MNIAAIAAIRLRNQQIGTSEFTTPAAIVRWFGAVQAQDYAAAKWALALRLPGITDKDIDAAFNEGSILRTHVMRPTWHFAAPEDIRWITALTAPRVNAKCAYMNRKMELDGAQFKQCNKIIINALKGNKFLTRKELGAVLEAKGIATNDLRLICIMMRAELNAVICSGPVKGKQFTYALLEERAPAAKTLKRDEALAELAKRYFASHGPATVQDYAWWSGLAMADAKAGIEMAVSKLQKEIINGQTYWYADAMHVPVEKKLLVYLLPVYDEYIIAYKDRTAVFHPQGLYEVRPGGNVAFNNTIILNGKVIGAWKRTIMKDKVVIAPVTYIKSTKALKTAIEKAADNYGAFLGLKAVLNW